MWQLAGVLRLDPRPFTLRELHWAHLAHQIDRWNHTAQLLATMENCRFGRKGRYTKPLDRHPYRQQLRRHVRRPKMSRQEAHSFLDSLCGL